MLRISGNSSTETQQALEELRARLKAAGGQKSAAATQSEARLNETRGLLRKKPELPPEVVSAGNFPGSFRIPGSDAAIKIGGMVWTSLVQTFDALGSDDRFLTYSIPVEATTEAGKGTPAVAVGGSVEVQLRRAHAHELGQMRAFIEGDFAGDGKTFRLRHAYGQFESIIVGQTWSTFSDPDADHWDIDLEGVNAENVNRQAQIRWRRTLRENLRLAVAVSPHGLDHRGRGRQPGARPRRRLVWQLPGTVTSRPRPCSARSAASSRTGPTWSRAPAPGACR